MALESSMVLPIFLFFMMTIVLSLEGVRLQSNVQEALYQAGAQRSGSGYQIKYEGRAGSSPEEQIKEYLDDQLYPYLCVAGGRDGISVRDLSSAGEDGRIEILAEYRLKPYIKWIPIGEVKIRDRFLGHSWTGYTGAAGNSREEQEKYVYVTKTGERYHLSHECTYLKVKIQGVSYEQSLVLRNQSGERYHPCQRCKPVKGGIVYITDEGNSFHSESDCPSLKRTVYMIPLSEADAYSACSKCGI